MITKKIALVYFLLVSMYSFSQDKVTIEIKNNLNFDRNEKVIAIDWNAIKAIYNEIDTSNLIIYSPKTKKQLPFQLEHKGKKEIQNLLILVDCKAKSDLTIVLKKGKKENFQTRTYGRYVPERKDDFAWENDKIAFRAYGKALEGTKENAYGYDVWVKSINKMVLNDRYAKGNYHVDQGNGMDYYHVGLTLGAGNMAPYYNDSIVYSGNYQQWKVLDNGPLRTSFELVYEDWNVGNSSIKQTKIISIDAGSQLNKIENSYTFTTLDSLKAVAGIIKRKRNDVILADEQNGIIGYWEPTHPKNGTTGVGIIIPEKTETIFEQQEQLLAKVTIKNNIPFVYYTGACWDKAGDFTNPKQWFEYLYNFKEEIKEPLKIAIK